MVSVRELKSGIPEGTADIAFGCDEIGTAGGVQDVLVARLNALRVVTVQQTVGSYGLEHMREFPPEVIGILMPLLAPRAPNGDT